MALPHYSEDQTSKKGRNFEPVQGNLFEVTILPPAGVSGQEFLLQQVNTVGGLEGLAPAVEAIGQKYKFADRSYAGMPGQTSIDLTINFSLNLNDSNQAYIYKTLRQWYRAAYNPETGEMGLKKNYVGTIVIVQFNREGDIYRKITLDDCFINTGVNLVDGLDYSDGEARSIEVGWKCDTYSEELA
tara:strand:+ start:869 stop:1426 length:558 start_codon:yes stop_codon:yes gene_type:complete